MEFIKFIKLPDIDMMPGVKVTKETEIEYENDNVKQEIKDLTFHSVARITGEKYTTTQETTIELEEGDVLLFLGEQGGYIKPVEKFVLIDEAIEELSRCYIG